MAYGGEAAGSFGPGCNGCRSARNVDTGLGFVPVATLTGIGIDLARKFIGGSKVTNCPGQPSGFDLGNLIASLNDSERAQLDAAARKVKAKYPSSWSWYNGLMGLDLDRFSFNLAGGEDCQVTSVDGKALVNLVHQFWAKYPAGGMAYAPSIPDQTVYPIDGGPIYNPIMGPAVVPIVPPPASSSSIDKILDLLKNAGNAGISAATNTAVRGAYETLPPEQQRMVQASVVRSSFDDYKLPLLIGGGLIVGFMVMGNRR